MDRVVRRGARTRRRRTNSPRRANTNVAASTIVPPGGRIPSSARGSCRSRRTGAIHVWWPNSAERIAGNVTILSAPLDPAAATALANQPPAPLERVHDGERAELAPPRPFDLPNGAWKTSAVDGQLRSAGEYRNGARHGEWRIRDAQGVEQTVNYRQAHHLWSRYGDRTDRATARCSDVPRTPPRCVAIAAIGRRRATDVDRMAARRSAGARQRMAAGALGRLAVNDTTAAESPAQAACAQTRRMICGSQSCRRQTSDD